MVRQLSLFQGLGLTSPLVRKAETLATDAKRAVSDVKRALLTVTPLTLHLFTLFAPRCLDWIFNPSELQR